MLNVLVLLASDFRFLPVGFPAPFVGYTPPPVGLYVRAFGMFVRLLVGPVPVLDEFFGTSFRLAMAAFSVERVVSSGGLFALGGPSLDRSREPFPGDLSEGFLSVRFAGLVTVLIVSFGVFQVMSAVRSKSVTGTLADGTTPTAVVPVPEKVAPRRAEVVPDTGVEPPTVTVVLADSL